MTTIPSIPPAVRNYLRSFGVTSIAVTGTGRIDPIVALTMAVGIASRPPPTIDVAALIG